MLTKCVKLLPILIAILLVVIGGYVFLIFPEQSIKLAEPRLITVSPGLGFNQLCRQLANEDVIERCGPLKWYSKFNPQLRAIKAGSYMVKPNIGHLALLVLLSSGREHQFTITFVEGDRLRDVLLKLADKPNLNQDIGDPAMLSHRLGVQHPHIEGLLFPDTYYYSANSGSFAIIKRAYQKMAKQLVQQWQNRAPDLPYQTAYEALIMASIIEKETGLATERKLIASVFINRLNKKMRLQTDPTVIYGMGDHFNGNITRKDLQQKTPYNTYRINGLPPTPIAMPGVEAIKAALNPAFSEYYYFVSKKDQSHYFSKTLQQHNKAVRKYQLGKTNG